MRATIAANRATALATRSARRARTEEKRRRAAARTASTVPRAAEEPLAYANTSETRLDIGGDHGEWEAKRRRVQPPCAAASSSSSSDQPAPLWVTASAAASASASSSGVVGPGDRRSSIVLSAIASERAAASLAAAAPVSDTVDCLSLGPIGDQALQDLALGTDQERSFLECTAKLRADLEAAQTVVAPSVVSYTSDLSSSALRDLVELVEMGLTVAWPSGLDARIARLILRGRS